ncbi:centlein-like [Gossypium australe]|uniref:Centlein-like n=1 Tax=Gossypium australe TaxID=47621 RepID=A0A5B6UGP6_9ROSI|nr:centlein-like [Gossypium australe]
MAALKAAYAKVILNTTKEAAARVIISEKRAALFRRQLDCSNKESLRLLLRLVKRPPKRAISNLGTTNGLSSQIAMEDLDKMDACIEGGVCRGITKHGKRSSGESDNFREKSSVVSAATGLFQQGVASFAFSVETHDRRQVSNSSSQTIEAETTSLNQKRKIDELEAQLHEAEDIITDLRVEINCLRDKLKIAKKTQEKPFSGEIISGDATASLKYPITKPTVQSPLNSGYVTVAESDMRGNVFDHGYLHRCCNATKQTGQPNVSHVESYYHHNSDLTTISMASKKQVLYTQRTCAPQRNLEMKHTINGNVKPYEDSHTVSSIRVGNVDRTESYTKPEEEFQHKSSSHEDVMTVYNGKVNIYNQLTEPYQSSSVPSSSAVCFNVDSNESDLKTGETEIKMKPLTRLGPGPTLIKCKVDPASNATDESSAMVDRTNDSIHIRKRKKEFLGNTDETTCKGRSLKRRAGAGEKENSLQEISKSKLVNECYKESRRLAQVAHQLNSLSGKRW